VIRSFLFVPGDSDKKLARSAGSEADAIIIDLEDAVTPSSRPAARARAAEFLAGPCAPERWVRINPLGTDDAVADLRAVMPAAPAGIVLPKPEGADAVRRLAALLDAFEAEHGRAPGTTRILPIVTERPAALFRLGDYAGASSRLAGLTWGAEDLSAALGASTNRDDAGRWLPPYELARSLCLVAAAAAEVPAIDTVYTNFRDRDGLAQYVAAAGRDGFSGMLAIHPDQVPVINAALQPSPEQIRQAERLVALFAEHPAAGALQLDGRMVDRPHLLRAERVLALAARQDKRQVRRPRTDTPGSRNQ